MKMEQIVANRDPSEPLVFSDNSEWLRYALLCCAVGMGTLAIDNLVGEVRDLGKIIGGTLGVLLFGFSGYLLQVRRLVVDPLRREITVTSKGLTRIVTDRCRFDDVTKLLVLLTYERNEELLPANRRSKRWSMSLVLKDRALPVTISSYASKEQALRDAKRIQELVKIEISDSAEEGLANLAQTGKTIDAVVAARQQLGMTLTQAKDHVNRIAGRRNS